jgi:hypothetical protein
MNVLTVAKRGLRLALATGIAAMGMAGPASVHAADLPASHCGVAAVGGLTICVQIVLETVPVGTNGNLSFICTAETQGAVAATGVGCYAQGNSSGHVQGAANVWLPGVASETQSLDNGGVPLDSYQVCWGADYLTTHGDKGSGSLTSWAITGCDSAL